MDTPLLYRWFADLLVVAHVLYVGFVVFGGLLVRRWRWVAGLHLPAVAWAVAVELAGWICPLTPLEVSWRRRAGAAGYAGGFVEEYLLPALYPPELTRTVQVGLGVAVLLLNVLLYARVWAVRHAARDPLA